MTTVSVVIPVRDAAPWIEDCLRSLNRQTYRDFEVVLVDDGSVDEGVALAEAITEVPLRVIRHDTARGVAQSLNDGIAAAQGAFIARLDADDCAFPHRLLYQLGRFSERPALDATFGWYRYISSSGRELPTEQLRRRADGARAAAVLTLGNPLCHPAVMVRREALERLQYRPSALADDWDLWLRARHAWVWEVDPEPVTFWRLRRSSQSHSARVRAGADLTATLLRCAKEDGLDLPPEIAAALALPPEHMTPTIARGCNNVLESALHSQQRGSPEWWLARRLAGTWILWAVQRDPRGACVILSRVAIRPELAAAASRAVAFKALRVITQFLPRPPLHPLQQRD